VCHALNSMRRHHSSCVSCVTAHTLTVCSLISAVFAALQASCLAAAPDSQPACCRFSSAAQPDLSAAMAALWRSSAAYGDDSSKFGSSSSSNM
jgi:hypothetical protein